MSQLSDIQDEILKRFKRPLPMDNQGGQSADGQQPNRDQSYLTDEQKRQAIASTSMGQTPQPISPGNAAPQSQSLWHPQPSAPVTLPTAQPSSISPYAPPMQPPAGAPIAMQPPSVDMSGAGPSPARINPQTGEPHRETFSGDPNKEVEYRDSLEKWKPTKHRSFGQVLKEGAIGLAQGAAANPNNPWAGVGGLAAGIGSGIVQPNVMNRAMKLGHADQDVARHLGEMKEEAQVANMGMVPVQTQDGRTLMIPRAKLGDWENKQRSLGQGDLRSQDRENRTRGYLAHLDTLQGDAKKKLTAQLYKTGALNTPEGLKYAAETMGVPLELQPAFIRGEYRDAIDEDGNFTEINRPTGRSTTVTGAGGQPAGSMQGTLEEGRNQRQAAGIANSQVTQNRIDARQGASGQRGAAPVRVSPATSRRAAALVGQIEAARATMAAPTATAADKDAAKAYGMKAAAELRALNAGYEAGEGPDHWPAASANSAPAQGAPPAEDPAIRAYANKHFRGNYQKALENARKTGYNQ